MLKAKSRWGYEVDFIKSFILQIVEVDVDRVMMYYEHEMRKSNKGGRNKSKVQVDHENSREAAGDIVKKVHKHKHKLRDNKQIEKNVNEIEIDPIASSPDIIAYDIPPQVTIKLHKKMCSDPKKVTDLGIKTVSAVIEHHDTAPSIEISEAAHHKHGHVRQHWGR